MGIFDKIKDSIFGDRKATPAAGSPSFSGVSSGSSSTAASPPPTPAATMTVPMAAWMRRRGHGWRPTNEMSASMIVPTLAVIALHGVGLMSDVGTMLVVEHVAMLAGMFAVMLLRPEEYSHHHRLAMA